VSGAGEFRQRLGRVESLVLALEELPDTVARETARELVRALLDLHALGLQRVLELAGDVGADRFASDPLVGSVLLLHALHPLPARERVNHALERTRARFHSLGGDVKLVTATDEAVHLQLSGDQAAGPALRAEIRELLIEAVPDVATVEFEEAWDKPSSGRLSLPMLNDVSKDAP
jgi:hypothetical protein